MKDMKLTRNPYLLFSPFLLFYVIYILIMQKPPLWGDEIRHMEEVHNLLNGFYSPPPPHVEIRNGPGYPLFMLPFIALGIPILVIKLMNAVFLYFSIIFLYRSLITFVSFPLTLAISIFWGCYYNSLDFIAIMHAEAMTAFLVSAILLLMVKGFSAEPKNKKYLYLAGIMIGYLALTKIIFGYVILCLVIGTGLLWLINRHKLSYRKGLIVTAVALASVVPYLAYTYSLTGKLFYWGTSGGDNLYWMSSTHEKEYGSWFPSTMLHIDSIVDRPDDKHEVNIHSTTVYIPGTEDSIRAHHLKTYSAIHKEVGVARDDAFRKAVYENIKANPKKYLQNIFANVGRILFNYPYSYTAQKPGTILRFPLNGTIIVFSLLCLIPTLRNWKKIPYPIQFLLFLTIIYLGGSVFGSAEIRMFTPIVPILLVWIGYVLQRSVKINMEMNNEVVQR